MKINIKPFQTLSKGMDTSLKKSLDSQEVDFEELILQVMSMVGMEILQDPELPEFNEEEVPQEIMEQLVQDLSTYTKSLNSFSKSQVLNEENITQGYQENNLESEVLIATINDEVKRGKSIQSTVEDIKIELDESIKSELKTKLDFHGSERGLIEKKTPYEGKT